MIRQTARNLLELAALALFVLAVAFWGDIIGAAVIAARLAQ